MKTIPGIIQHSVLQLYVSTYFSLHHYWIEHVQSVNNFLSKYNQPNQLFAFDSDVLIIHSAVNLTSFRTTYDLSIHLL
jgi:hypothetical protein